MNASFFLLAIDSGNTAIKWGLHDGTQWLACGNILQGERMMLQQAWETLPVPASVLISNVAGSRAASDLTALLKPWRIQPQWIMASASQCGITSRYAKPEQLGSDRWMALIAAWHRMQRMCLVVDAGTAMTVDALSSTGEFLGGIIVPGPDLMKKALAGRVGALTTSVSGRFQDFPTNTENALYSGMIQALTGALERMGCLLARYSEKQAPVEIIVTGGGAALLDQHIHAPHQIIDNLVLEGLVIIAKSDHPGYNKK
ncbi:type III pantothenate kinase [Nitrosomonas sp. HPC101]|uniref:type III pantothenate kinase n=1 Tax=Nitrosomonas sp. HPC101 TaxID=1658667 RepID=UPI00136C1F86|nr:type III pantothenate kinase [Nitrosomonas sp. HPC101]MXS84896.1 type III pantothenate kinase [Nitrosomonas sp. HPC101]